MNDQIRMLKEALVRFEGPPGEEQRDELLGNFPHGSHEIARFLRAVEPQMPAFEWVYDELARAAIVI